MRVGLNPLIRYNKIHLKGNDKPALKCTNELNSAGIMSLNVATNPLSSCSSFKSSHLKSKNVNLKKDEKKKQNYTSKEIIIAKTKKTLSECRVVAFAVIILYFALKHNFKINAEKNAILESRRKVIQKAPHVDINPILGEDFLQF